MSEQNTNQTKKIWNWKKTVLIIAGIVLVIYGIGAFYYHSHFFFGSTINGHKAANKTVAQMEQVVDNDFQAHDITLIERKDKKEVIKASDIQMVVDTQNNVSDLLEAQNEYLWFKAFFEKNNYTFKCKVTYSEEALEETVNNLECFKKENIEKPVNAKIKLDGDTFKVIDEVYGTTVVKDTLLEKVKTALDYSETEINLEEAQCYKNPTILASGKEVEKALKKIDTYMAAVTTYDFDYTTETVDKNLIKNWIVISKKMKVSLDYDKVLDYIEELADKYDTFARNRKFKTTYGSEITVVGGNYGWKISQTRETKNLMEELAKGKSVTRKPLYLYEAVYRGKGNVDIDDTYVEISISAQYMWYYKNGKCIVSTPVVTGDASKGRSTPKGTYMLNYKQRNATLSGQGYSSGVSYWMPFNGNIGIHDATWRSSFGGSIYRGNGSHGCVNTPFYNAKTIYENIEAGCPIVIY